MIIKSMREISKDEGMNWRTVKKRVYIVYKRLKTGKIKKVGYIMERDILDYKKRDGEDLQK